MMPPRFPHGASPVTLRARGEQMKIARFVFTVAVALMATSACAPSLRSVVLTDPVESNGIVWMGQQRMSASGRSEEARVIACSTRTERVCVVIGPSHVGDLRAWLADVRE